MQERATTILFIAGFLAAGGLVALTAALNELRKGNQKIGLWLFLFFICSVLTLVLMWALLQGMITLLPK